MSVVKVVSSIQEVNDTIQKHELETNTRFAAYKSTKNFGNSVPHKGLGVVFTDRKNVTEGRVTFSGCPFSVGGKKVLDCQFGANRKHARRNASGHKDHDYTRRKRFLPMASKKIDCPAKIIVREILHFHTFKVERNALAKQGRIAIQTIKEQLVVSTLPFKRSFYVTLPGRETHTTHPLIQGGPEPMDPRVVDYIKKKTEEGVVSVGEMKRHLSAFIKELMGGSLPHPTNQRFYPKKTTIAVHMSNCRNPLKTQDNMELSDLVDAMKMKMPEDYLFYRAKSENCLGDELQESTMLFIYQSANQKALLKRYGHMVFMDSTFNTTKYDVPLFFLCVRTNVDYQPVACFITETERADHIAEALALLKEHGNLNPEQVMTDFDESEISAITSVFPRTKKLICDFHREQAWDRWVRRKDNRVADSSRVMTLFRDLAKAESEESFNAKFELCREELRGTQSHVLDYLNRTWMPVKESWVSAYRKDVPIIAGTNNGVERMHGVFKNTYLHRNRSHNLTFMVKVLVENFCVDQHESYRRANQNASGGFKKFREEIPVFLTNRPFKVMKHCMMGMQKAYELTKEECSTVTFGNLPSCSCYPWRYHHLPCKHMFGSILTDDQFDFELLGSSYWDSPYVTLDLPENVADKEECDTTENPCGQEEMETEVEDQHDSLSSKLQKSCREKLRQLTNISYREERQTILLNLNRTLQNLLTRFSCRKTLPLRLRRKRRKVNLKRKGKKADVLREHVITKLPEDNTAVRQIHIVKKTERRAPLNGIPLDNATDWFHLWETEQGEAPECRVNAYQLTGESFNFLRTTLSDELMDAYLSVLVQGKNILHIDSIVGTAIFTGRRNIHDHLRNVNFDTYDYCMCAVNEGGHHWVLLVIDPKNKTILYINPLGETMTKCQTILQYWYNFLGGRTAEQIDERVEGWSMQTVDHVKQFDGISCGIFVLKFAEKIILGESLLFPWSNAAIFEERIRIGRILLQAGIVTRQDSEATDIGESNYDRTVPVQEHTIPVRIPNPQAEHDMGERQDEGTDPLQEPTIPVRISSPQAEHDMGERQDEGTDPPLQEPTIPVRISSPQAEHDMGERQDEGTDPPLQEPTIPVRSSSPQAEHDMGERQDEGTDPPLQEPTIPVRSSSPQAEHDMGERQDEGTDPPLQEPTIPVRISSPQAEHDMGERQDEGTDPPLQEPTIPVRSSSPQTEHDMGERQDEGTDPPLQEPTIPVRSSSPQAEHDMGERQDEGTDPPLQEPTIPVRSSSPQAEHDMGERQDEGTDPPLQEPTIPVRSSSPQAEHDMGERQDEGTDPPLQEPTIPVRISSPQAEHDMCESNEEGTLPVQGSIIPGGSERAEHMKLRTKRYKKRRSSFFYTTPKKAKRATAVYCICKRKDDGRKYWQCERCEQWFHPSCLGLNESDEPDAFFCTECSLQRDTSDEEIEDVQTAADLHSVKLLDDWNEIKTHVKFIDTVIKDIVDCDDDNGECSEVSHVSHHKFVHNHVQFVRENRFKHLYGATFISPSNYHKLVNYLFSERFTVTIRDPLLPVTGMRIALLKCLHEESKLYRLLLKEKNLMHYITHVLAKDVMANLVAMKSSRLLDIVYQQCYATEVSLKAKHK